MLDFLRRTGDIRSINHLAWRGCLTRDSSASLGGSDLRSSHILIRLVRVCSILLADRLGISGPSRQSYETATSNAGMRSPKSYFPRFWPWQNVTFLRATQRVYTGSRTYLEFLLYFWTRIVCTRIVNRFVRPISRFFMGTKGISDEARQALYYEQKLFGDLVLFSDFKDEYESLSTKGALIWEHIFHSNVNTHFVYKQDDNAQLDVVVLWEVRLVLITYYIGIKYQICCFSTSSTLS